MFVQPNSPYFTYDLNGNQFVQSQFSPGGNYSMAPTNQYINPVQNAAQPQSSSGPNLLDIGQQVNKLGSNNSGGTGILGNVTSAINNVGTGLGFAPGTVTYPASSFAAVGPNLPGVAAVGPSAPVNAISGVTGTPVTGSLGTTATLSNVLGGAGFGALAGNFLGRIGGSSTGGTIGGALGGALGAASGLSSGIALGGKLGSIVPGLGTVLGAAAGGLIGGFFGGKKPATSSSAWMGYEMKPDGTFKSSYGSKNNNTNFNKSLESDMAKIMQGAHKDLGINWDSNISLFGGYNSLHSGDKSKPGYIDSLIRYGQDNEEPGSRKRFTYDPSKPEERDAAYLNALKNAAQLNGYTDTAKLDAWFKTKVAGNSNRNTGYTVPFKDTQRFNDFITKFKTEGNINAPNGTPTPAT